MNHKSTLTRNEVDEIIKYQCERLFEKLAAKIDDSLRQIEIRQCKRMKEIYNRNRTLLRETLWHASGKLPQYKPTDRRNVNVVKASMVQAAISRILENKTTTPRATVYSVLNQYKGIDGAYEDFGAFMKQVSRLLTKSGHSFKNMSQFFREK